MRIIEKSFMTGKSEGQLKLGNFHSFKLEKIPSAWPDLADWPSHPLRPQKPTAWRKF